MVGKMNKDKIVVYVAIILLIVIISIPTIIKINNKHNQRLSNVVINEIITAAKNCFYSESCVENEITLEELYEKTNLEKVVNPITKKEYNKASYVDVKKNFEFIEK